MHDSNSLAAGQPGARPAAEAYESATIEANRDLIIVKTGGQTVMVWKEGEQTAFSASTQHELRDIQSERPIETADVPQPCGQIPQPKPVKSPDWVAR